MKKYTILLTFIIFNISFCQESFKSINTANFVDGVFIEDFDLDPIFISNSKIIKKDTILKGKRYYGQIFFSTNLKYQKYKDSLRIEDSIKKLIPLNKLHKFVGKVSYNPGFKKPKKKIEDYKVYLYENENKNGSNRLILKSKKSDFEIYLSDKEIKKFKFFEFRRNDFAKIIKIDKNVKDSILVFIKPNVEYSIGKPAIYGNL